MPQITLQFWIIKVCCTTVGETLADYLTNDAGLGQGGTLALMGFFLLLALAGQFYVDHYVPALYWLAVILMSIEGTLITDCVHDFFGVELWVTTVIFLVLMLVVFGMWYKDQHTLDIHSVYTVRREAWYWAAILLTFACGTASGDFLASKMGSLWLPFVVFSLWLGVIAMAWAYSLLPRLSCGLLSVESSTIFLFWFAYIITRPLGASIGDGLAHGPESEHTVDDPGPGAGLGPMWTSLLLLLLILINVVYLTVTKKDLMTAKEEAALKEKEKLSAAHAPAAGVTMATMATMA